MSKSSRARIIAINFYLFMQCGLKLSVLVFNVNCTVTPLGCVLCSIINLWFNQLLLSFSNYDMNTNYLLAYVTTIMHQTQVYWNLIIIKICFSPLVAILKNTVQTISLCKQQILYFCITDKPTNRNYRGEGYQGVSHEGNRKKMSQSYLLPVEY